MAETATCCALATLRGAATHAGLCLVLVVNPWSRSQGRLQRHPRRIDDASSRRDFLPIADVVPGLQL